MKARAEIYHAAPSALHYMLQAARPKPGWSAARGFPDLTLIWRGYRIAPHAIGVLQEISGIEDARSDGLLFHLVPHVTGFRLLMAMLTHPSWPLPIWNALQVRNRLTMHAPLNAESADLITRTAGWRVLPRGIEVDLSTRLQQGVDCLWESVVTFYYRGQFGPAAEQVDLAGAAAASPVVDQFSERPHHWRIGDGGRWRFCALNGDYNGLHLWNRYAHHAGFNTAFPHPQRVAAQCLGHLMPSDQLPRQFDLWIKGPVPFGSDVVQREPLLKDGGQDFALWIEGAERPALVGSLQGILQEADAADDTDAATE